MRTRWSRPSANTPARATSASSTTSRGCRLSVRRSPPLFLDQPLGDLGRGCGTGLAREREAAVELERLAVQGGGRVAGPPVHERRELLQRRPAPARGGPPPRAPAPRVPG